MNLEHRPTERLEPGVRRDARPHPANPGALIVLYDDDCGFCQEMVRLLSRRAPDLDFEPQRSARGCCLLAEHGLDRASLDSVVVIDRHRALTQSAALIRLMRLIRPLSLLAYLAAALPPGLLQTAYTWLAQNRHRLPGGSSSCSIR